MKARREKALARLEERVELLEGAPRGGTALGEPRAAPWWKNKYFWMAVAGILVFLASLGGGAYLVMTYTDKKSFAKMMDAILASLGLAPETRIIVLAHAGVETALGTAGTAPTGNNFWNISAGTTEKPSSSWTGPVVLGGDQEPDGQGGWKNIVQRWRAYADPLEGAKDYLKFLSRTTPIPGFKKTYADAWAKALAGDVMGFVYTLREAGYYTADASRYLAMMNGQIGLVRKLLEAA